MSLTIHTPIFISLAKFRGCSLLPKIFSAANQALAYTLGQRRATPSVRRQYGSVQLSKSSG